MGLIKAGLSAVGSMLGDQWKEYFYCDALPEDVLMRRGQKKVSGRSSNTHGSDNVISSGSVIAVADGQCMLIVEQGKIVEVCAEPGEFKFDSSTEPSIFAGGLNWENIKAVFSTVGKRFTFGGETPQDQRVYYINTKELYGNKYGTPSPIPFRVVDQRAGIDTDISIKCFGEYSYAITNPLLFYTKVCGNVADEYKRDQLDSQIKSELLTALQPAFALISEMGVRYSALPAHTMDIADKLNEVLSAKWRDLRGIEIVSFGVSSVKANEEDEQMIKDMQREATYMDPNRAAGATVAATNAAMRDAAKNPNGAMMGFMGMNMAGMQGGNMAANLFQMGAAQQTAQPQMAPQAAPAPAAAPAANSWTCSCGATATGKFCPECGTAKPIPVEGWTCKCGAVNKGKFCSECGSPQPAGTPKYKCDKCGWEPEDPANPPKFCPECGDPFDEGDLV